MITVVAVPDLGVNDTTGTLSERLVADGAVVHEGMPLCTLETTKVAIDLEAQAAGILAWLVDDGAVVPVYTAVAIIAADAAELAAELARRRELAAAAAGPRWTSKARALMAEHGLDEVLFASHAGLVRESDVLAHIASLYK